MFSGDTNVWPKSNVQVQDAGGLLVIGTSMNDSRRVEQQLRGRAGRQGDRGSSIMMYDASDSNILMYGANGEHDSARVDIRRTN